MCADAIAIYHEAVARGLVASRPFVGNGLWVTSLTDPDGHGWISKAQRMFRRKRRTRAGMTISCPDIMWRLPKFIRSRQKQVHELALPSEIRA
jgi:hypothetical protein